MADAGPGSGAIATPAADLLCLLAGDVRRDGRGYARMAVIREFLDPFAAGDLDEALTTVARRMASATGANRCSLYLRNEEGTHLLLAACAGPRGARAAPPPMASLPVEMLPDWVCEAEVLGHSVAMTGSRGSRRRLPGLRPLLAADPEGPARRSNGRRRGGAPVMQGGKGPVPLPWEARPVLAIPLAACGRAIGILFLDGDAQSLTLTREHLRLANILGAALGPAIGAALRSSVLYERQRSVTETMRRSLIPDLPADIEGIEVGHVFLPKSDQVGGDHYDLIPLGGGRIGILIGDVAGSGVRAAIHTNMARYMARALAFEIPDPGGVIRKLNDAICTGGESEVFLTLFCGVLEPSGRLRYANGAHPYPIIRRAGSGPALLLETTGTVVGIIPDQVYEEREVRLHSGDILLLYTDGVTEADREGELFGMERVQALAQEWRGKHPQELADALLGAVREFCGGHIRDDLAILAIRRR